MAKNRDIFERNSRRFEAFFASVARSVWRRGNGIFGTVFVLRRQRVEKPRSSLLLLLRHPLNAAALSPFLMRRCPSPVAAQTPLPHSRTFGLRPSPSHSGGGGFGVGVFFFIFWGFVFPSLCSYCSICLRLSPQGLCICTHCRILPHGSRFQSPA